MGSGKQLNCRRLCEFEVRHTPAFRTPIRSCAEIVAADMAQADGAATQAIPQRKQCRQSETKQQKADGPIGNRYIDLFLNVRPKLGICWIHLNDRLPRICRAVSGKTKKAGTEIIGGLYVLYGLKVS